MPNKNNKKKPVFIQNLSVHFNGNLGMLEKEDSVALVANVMAENGFRSIVVTVDTMGLQNLKSPEERHTRPDVEIYNFKNFFEYYGFMKKFPDATVFGNARTFLGMSTCLFGKYRIFMNHGSALPKKWWQKLVLKFFLKRFDAIKGESESEKKNLVKLGLDPEKIFVIPIPIDYEFFSQKPGKDKIAELKKRYGIKNNETVLLFLAALREQKRADTVVSAVKVLKDKGVPIKLLQIGKDILKERIGKSFKELVDEANISDITIMTGRVSDKDLLALMHLADIGLQPSEVEGQCIVAFEYAAVGIPVCLSDIPSFDIFRSNALRCRPNDYKKLADNIKYYIKHPAVAKKHAKNNQKMVMQKYDYDKIRKEMKHLLVDLNPKHIEKKN